MKKLHFEISMHASPEKVWNAIVNEKQYQEWTKAFNETSSFEGGWKKGDKIRFIGVNDKGEMEGMVSEIAESTKPTFISIRHLGLIHNGAEDTTSEEAKKWTPAYENYTFIKKGGDTVFKVELDTDESMEKMFSDMWPKALKLLKNVAEKEVY